MVHWAFLILVFVVGFILGCLTVYHLVHLAARVEGAINEAAKNAVWRW